MKKLYILIITSFILLSCVQKSYKQKVIFTLKLENAKDIKSVGIRGNDKPLNWNEDYQLKAIKKDSLYEATLVFDTGYKFTEVKFTLNGEFELKDKPNRRIFFDDSKITHYNAVYNLAK